MTRATVKPEAVMKLVITGPMELKGFSVYAELWRGAELVSNAMRLALVRVAQEGPGVARVAFMPPLKFTAGDSLLFLPVEGVGEEAGTVDIEFSLEPAP